MDWEKWQQYFRKYKKIVIVVVALLMVVVISAVGLIGKFSSGKKIVTPPFTMESMEVQEETTISNGEISCSTESQIMYVDVKGAVQKPGVYEFSVNMRVWDAIELAGGFTSEADETKVNLAKTLTDQMLVYIPKVGEELPESVPQENHGEVTPSEEKAANGKINLNTADVMTLQKLQGIGEKKAEAILNYRKENGAFQEIEEIKKVSGIGEKLFESLKNQICV